MRWCSAAGAVALVLVAAAVAPGVAAAPGQASPTASSHVGQTPRQTCDRPRPTGFRKAKRWGCFSISAKIQWQTDLLSSPAAPCRGGGHVSVRWSGSGGAYWIADNITIRRAWNGAPARWSLRDIIMVGPASFDVRLTGEAAAQGTCVPAATLMPGCGSRTIPGYTAGILASIAAPSGSGYFWTPAPYLTQRPPDYSACGGVQLSVQPLWRTFVRYGGVASFAFKRMDLGARLLTTGVGRTLVLRAQDEPDSASGLAQGTWTATIAAKRIR